MTKKLISFDDSSNTMPGVVETRISVLAADAANSKVDSTQVKTATDLGGNTPSDTDVASQKAVKTHVDFYRKRLIRNPELLITGSITRDTNGAVTTAEVVWPDGTPGEYNALELSTSFPGAVDSWEITYGDPVTKTYTQPTVTRDASTGIITNLPAVTES